MKELKKKHSIWLSVSAWDNVENHYQADNCSTKNEYIEKAIQFYSGYLDTQHAEAYLPRVLSDVLEGKLGAFGKRMGHLLFKQAVGGDIVANLAVAFFHVDEDKLQKDNFPLAFDAPSTAALFSGRETFSWRKVEKGARTA